MARWSMPPGKDPGTLAAAARPPGDGGAPSSTRSVGCGLLEGSFLSTLLGFQKLRQGDNLRPLTQERPQIAEIVIAFHLRECDRQ
jgi:hypothetical protein